MRIKLILNYLHYLLTAQTKHDVHSPFVFNLLTNVIHDKKKTGLYSRIEAIRRELLHSTEKISVNDLGAGSAVNRAPQRKIRDMARHSLKQPKYAQLLFRLVNHFRPQRMLELGTSFGISTLYQAAGNPHARFITMEGCPETAAVARKIFTAHDPGHILLVTGNFDTELSHQARKLERLDYVFFDGNHRKDPTLRYFECCLPFVTNDTLFVFDDIYWSDEMKAAWQSIRHHPKVTVTIDLFFLGLVFFRKEQVKQHFKIRF